MEKQKCAGRTYDSMHRGFYACTRNGSLEHGGKMWCKTHHPPTVEAKTKAQNENWMAKARMQREAARAENIKSDLRDRAWAWMRETRPDIIAAWEVELEAKWKS